MQKLLKYPIYIFGTLAIILIVCVTLYLVSNDYPLGHITGFFWVGYFCLTYSPLIIISLVFLNFTTPYRRRFEVALIVVYLLTIYFVQLKPEPANEIYLYNQNQSLSEYDQNFIIVFGIEGQSKLDDNFYFNNKINIPEDGIYLTSSTFSDGWGGRFGIWQVKGLSEWNYEAATYSHHYGDLYSCNNKRDVKLEFMAMTVNPSNGFDSKWFDTIVEKICKKINNEGL